jgi:hypothetical protein
MGDIIFGIASILLGVAGSWGLYWVLDRLVRFLPIKLQEKLRAVSFFLSYRSSKLWFGRS